MTAEQCTHPCIYCAVERAHSDPPAPPQPAVPDPLPDRNLTVVEAADVLGCSEQHLRTVIQRGDLPAFKFAGGLKVRRSTVDRFMADLEQQATS